jgi:hypothetical protein
MGEGAVNAGTHTVCESCREACRQIAVEYAETMRGQEAGAASAGRAVQAMGAAAAAATTIAARIADLPTRAAGEARSIAYCLVGSKIDTGLIHDMSTIAARQEFAEEIVQALIAHARAAEERAIERCAKIADNLGNWADAKRPRDEIADAEHVICTRIAAAIRAGASRSAGE